MDPAPAATICDDRRKNGYQNKKNNENEKSKQTPEPFGSRSMRDTPTTAIIVEIAPMIAIDHLADFFTSDQVAI